MRKQLVISALLWLLTFSLAQAQTPAPANPAPTVLDAPASVNFTEELQAAPRAWVTCDYLIWWIEDSPLPIPVVTTSTNNPPGPLSGQIGQPGTQVLLGNSKLDYRSFSGVSPTIGGWVDENRFFGLESTGFLLEHRTVGFVASSDATGTPVLFVPFDTPAGLESGTAVAMPSGLLTPPTTGSLVVASAIRLWGAEANSIFQLLNSGAFSGQLLAGVRYVDLGENLSLQANSAIGGPAPMTLAQSDSFDTHNQFAGGQIGSRLAYSTGRLSMDFLGKVALGSTHQVVNVAGMTTTTGGILPAVIDGGIFAQPSNSGRSTRDEFTVLPEMELKLGYGLLPNLRTYVGYTFLYWSSVARPGDQIDRTVNVSQNLALGGGGTLVGPARPGPQLNQSDLFAHGVRMGLEWDW